MNVTLTFLIILFLPVAGAFILPLLGAVSKNLRNITALLLIVASVVASFTALPAALRGTPLHMNIDFPLGFNFGLQADGLAVFMGIVSAFIGAVIIYYSFGYISHYKNQDEYYLMVVLFIGSMMGIVYSTNLIFMYLFWEIAAISCWRLIGFFREKEYIVKADKAFLVTVAGAVVMLIGFILIYFQTGTFDLLKMKGTRIPDLAVFLILFGIFSKSATLPLHTWLPDAGVAPSPVTALLHAAVLVKIGIYAFARFFLVTFEVNPIWHTIIPVVAAASALVSAGAALVETDLKRLIAYSTISQLAFIFLGLSTGSLIGAAGALLYILMHGLAKGGLFLCAGIVEQNTKTRDITKLSGLISTMPVTAIMFAICAFSVMGIPPLGGFFSKIMVIRGAVDAGEPWIAVTFIAGAVLTIIYLLRVFIMVFLGDAKFPGVKEGSFSMVASVTIFAVLSILAGIMIHIPAGFINAISKQLEMVYK